MSSSEQEDEDDLDMQIEHLNFGNVYTTIRAAKRILANECITETQTKRVQASLHSLQTKLSKFAFVKNERPEKVSEEQTRLGDHFTQHKNGLRWQCNHCKEIQEYHKEEGKTKRVFNKEIDPSLKEFVDTCRAMNDKDLPDEKKKLKANLTKIYAKKFKEPHSKRCTAYDFATKVKRRSDCKMDVSNKRAKIVSNDAGASETKSPASSKKPENQVSINAGTSETESPSSSKKPENQASGNDGSVVPDDDKTNATIPPSSQICKQPYCGCGLDAPIPKSGLCYEHSLTICNHATCIQELSKDDRKANKKLKKEDPLTKSHFCKPACYKSAAEEQGLEYIPHKYEEGFSLKNKYDGKKCMVDTCKTKVNVPPFCLEHYRHSTKVECLKEGCKDSRPPNDPFCRKHGIEHSAPHAHQPNNSSSSGSDSDEDDEEIDVSVVKGNLKRKRAKTGKAANSAPVKRKKPESPPLRSSPRKGQGGSKVD